MKKHDFFKKGKRYVIVRFEEEIDGMIGVEFTAKRKTFIEFVYSTKYPESKNNLYTPYMVLRSDCEEIK